MKPCWRSASRRSQGVRSRPRSGTSPKVGGLSVFPGRHIGRRFPVPPGPPGALRHESEDADDLAPRPPAAPGELTGHTAEAWTVAFSPDGKVLATGSDDTRERQTIRLWDPASGRSLAGWKGHTATVSSLAFSPDGRLLASGSLDSGKPGNPNVILWDVASHQRLASLEGHTGRVRSAGIQPGRPMAGDRQR